MPESTYRIRVRKFSEMIRDINRQLPLLREELAKRKKGETLDQRLKKKKRANILAKLKKSKNKKKRSRKKHK